MNENRPSATAQRVALSRAAHQLLDDPRVLDDPIALRIVGAAAAADLRTDPRKFEGNRVAPFLRAFMAVRSRFAEDELAVAVRKGVQRYAILGAGLDTFAYRNPYRGLRVFEIDHPATQAWKRRRLQEEGIPVPESVTFVPVDFENDDAVATFGHMGSDLGKPVFFSWLGVTPYVAPESVLATLRSIAGLTQGGGGLVFDYAVPPALLGPLQRRAFAAIAARVKAAGEPWRCFFEPAALIQELRAMGYRDAEDPVRTTSIPATSAVEPTGSESGASHVSWWPVGDRAPRKGVLHAPRFLLVR